MKIKKRIKKILLSIIFFICIFIFSACGSFKTLKIYDYYREYKFELPFEYDHKSKKDIIIFDKDLSIEEMSILINEANYNSSVYEFDGLKRMLITVTEDKYVYYYIIYDKTESNENYILRDCSKDIKFKKFIFTQFYIFLFPLHYSKIDNVSSDVIEVYCTFEDFASFYEATGKNNYEIDYINKKLRFYCDGDYRMHFDNGYVNFEYIENENGAFILIK